MRGRAGDSIGRSEERGNAFDADARCIQRERRRELVGAILADDCDPVFAGCLSNLMESIDIAERGWAGLATCAGASAEKSVAVSILWRPLPISVVSSNSLIISLVSERVAKRTDSRTSKSS
jgi:hypothetical protein